MATKTQWDKKDLVKLFEVLIEKDSALTSCTAFRDLLTRNENLFANQLTREANGNIAYRSVDFDCLEVSDEDFWERMNDTRYRDLIEDNAAIAMFKMAEKLKLVS